MGYAHILSGASLLALSLYLSNKEEKKEGKEGVTREMGKIRVDRKGYYRSDGTWVRPTSYLMDDPGMPGRGARGSKSGPYRESLGYEPWIKREGKLGGAGYTEKHERTRHHLLNRSVDKHGYRSTLGSLQVLLRSSEIGQSKRKVLERDKDWLVEKYGGPGSFGRKK